MNNNQNSNSEISKHLAREWEQNIIPSSSIFNPSFMTFCLICAIRDPLAEKPFVWRAVLQKNQLSDFDMNIPG